MGMMFGGWAEEEDEKDEVEKATDRAFSNGLQAGRKSQTERLQRMVAQDMNLDHSLKKIIWDLLEEYKKKS